jgi:hypothetical protein
MAVCKVCGDDHGKAFQVTTARGEARTFDSFECAIHALAPTCRRCGVRVVGHGVEQGGDIFCGAPCAQEEGATRLQDRA